jgi:hypothetical protein
LLVLIHGFSWFQVDLAFPHHPHHFHPSNSMNFDPKIPNFCRKSRPRSRSRVDPASVERYYRLTRPEQPNEREKHELKTPEQYNCWGSGSTTGGAVLLPPPAVLPLRLRAGRRDEEARAVLAAVVATVLQLGAVLPLPLPQNST